MSLGVTYSECSMFHNNKMGKHCQDCSGPVIISRRIKRENEHWGAKTNASAGIHCDDPWFCSNKPKHSIIKIHSPSNYFERSLRDYMMFIFLHDNSWNVIQGNRFVSFVFQYLVAKTWHKLRLPILAEVII
jgi:hypothetical protein